MTDKPIIFSGPMIRALLDGRKSQTRRVLKPQPDYVFRKVGTEQVAGMERIIGESASGTEQRVTLPLPYAVGDHLWVQEEFNIFTFSEDGEEAWPTENIPTAEEHREVKEAAYRFDQQIIYRESDRARKWFADQKWRPSIHMPRWAARLTLVVTDVRVQRLQEISEADAIREGVECETCKAIGQSACYRKGCPAAKVAFRDLWNSLHGPDAWDQNLWVVALTFTTHRCNIDQMGDAA